MKKTMITPRFKLSQTETTVTINIRAPYCDFVDLDVTVAADSFLFYSTPYYLRLHLPGRLVEGDDFMQSSFDADSGEFTFNFTKVNEGEHFPDLDLINKLLRPKIQLDYPYDDARKITIETNGEPAQMNGEELNEEFGFALSGKRDFRYVADEFRGVFEINPREVGREERHKMRVQVENKDFNMDHYVADFKDDEHISEMRKLPTGLSQLKKEEIAFDDSDLDFLKDLGNKRYNLSEAQINYCHNSLIDILFAYCYDLRTTDFEGNIESGWTIVKLSASLSWLDVFQTPKDALVSGFRRSVIYPLYRHFELSQTVLSDLREVLSLGEKYIIKCLIKIHKIFQQGDCRRYILNDLFIKDYIIYIMQWDKDKWQNIVRQVEDVSIGKSHLGLSLEDIEDNSSELAATFAHLNITKQDSDDDEESDSDSDSSGSNSSESESD